MMPSKFIVGLALLVWWHWPLAARRRYRRRGKRFRRRSTLARASSAALSAQGWVPAPALSLAAPYPCRICALIGGPVGLRAR
jgi:hypothetical protein